MKRAIGWMLLLAPFVEAAAELKAARASHTHQWSRWQEVGRTGDWFHPRIVERTCVICGATETEDL